MEFNGLDLTSWADEDNETCFVFKSLSPPPNRFIGNVILKLYVL